MRLLCLASAVRSRAGCLGCIAVLMTAAIAPQVRAASTPHPWAVSAMEMFLARPITTHQYSAWRRLEASGGGQSGWLDVQTDFAPASGMLYEVMAEGGSRYIRARVLRSLLDEESRLAELGGASVAISVENYEFVPESLTEEGLAVVAMKPRRKDRSLVRGHMYLTADGDLVRIEGRLARNPTFWVTRVNITRSYQRLNGVLVPVSLDTTAKLRLLGASALRMTYVYSLVDERPVVRDAPLSPE